MIHSKETIYKRIVAEPVVRLLKGDLRSYVPNNAIKLDEACRFAQAILTDKERIFVCCDLVGQERLPDHLLMRGWLVYDIDSPYSYRLVDSSEEDFFDRADVFAIITNVLTYYDRFDPYELDGGLGDYTMTLRKLVDGLRRRDADAFCLELRAQHSLEEIYALLCIWADLMENSTHRESFLSAAQKTKELCLARENRTVA